MRLGLVGLSGHRDLEIEFFEIWYSGSGSATVAVTTDAVVIDVSLGTTTTTTSGYPTEFAFEDYETVDEITSAIESYDSDWITITYNHGSALSSSLSYTEETSCTGYTNRVALEGERNYWLGSLLDQVSDWIERWCYRHFEQDTYTEIISGNGDKKLYLQNYPVSSITSASTWDGSSWDTVSSSSYDVDEDLGILYRKAGWTEGWDNIRVVYVAGYATIPKELQDLVCDVAAVYYFKHGRDPLLTLEKVGSYREEVAKDFLGEDLRYRLRMWMRYDV
jgi:hypothetical protein